MRTKLFCVKHNTYHDDNPPWTWSHRKWQVEGGEIEGWGCSGPSRRGITMEQRQRIAGYEKDLIQPFREGEFSQEFKEAYPDVSREMMKEGSLTKKQFDGAKEVWKGDL